MLLASGSRLESVATALPAAMFSLKVFADRFRAVGVSFTLDTASVNAFSKESPPASLVRKRML